MQKKESISPKELSIFGYLLCSLLVFLLFSLKSSPLLTRNLSVATFVVLLLTIFTPEALIYIYKPIYFVTSNIGKIISFMK